MRNSGIFLILLSIFICLSACKSQQKAILQPNDNDIKMAQMIIDAAIEREIGNIEKSCEIYESILKINPENALAYYQLAAINYEQRNIAKAIEYNVKAVELDKKNHWYRCQLAEIYIQTKQHEKAAEQYKAIVELQPKVTEYYMELASIYIDANMYDKAIEVINLLEKRQGINEYCSMFKYKVYKQLNNPEKAIKEIEKLSKEYPSNVSYLSILAQNYLSKENLPKALEFMKEIEKIDSSNIENIVALMEFYYKKDDTSLTETYIDKLCRSTEMNFEEKNQLILGLYKAKVDEDIETLRNYIKHLESMSNMYPEEGPLWQFLSIGYMRTFRMDEAYQACKKAIEYGVKDLDLYKRYIILQQVRVEDDEERIKTCDDAIKLYPRECIFYIVKGYSLVNLKEYEKAIETLEKGLKYAKQQSDYIDIYSNLAEAYYRTENKDKAFEYFEKALKKDANNLMILNNYAYYLCLENQDLDKAEKMSKQTYDNQSHNITFADTYAWILHTKGEHMKAKEVLDKFLDNKNEWSETVSNHYQEILEAIK
jgi:tetratricopeptide (TPR) repeat protein